MYVMVSVLVNTIRMPKDVIVFVGSTVDVTIVVWNSSEDGTIT